MFDHILVPLDGSKLAECVLPHVVAIARPFRSQVTLLQVLEAGSEHTTAGSFVDPFRWQLGIAETEAYLDGVARSLGDAGIGTQRVILEGCPARQIVEFARSHDVDLIVLSSHGRSGLSRWNLNSVAYKVVSLAYLSVMIVRAYRSVDSSLVDFSYRRLLVPLDGSRRAECVLPLATTLASFYDSDVVLANVVSKPQMICLEPLPREIV
jgi:nucleotide-binding universal stress UspA family protein